MTLGEIHSRFSEMETELGLFSRQINGIYFWKLVRVPLFLKVIRQCGLHESTTQEKKASVAINDRFYTVWNLVKNALRYSAFKSADFQDILIFENARKVKGETGYYDPYTIDLVQKLQKEDIAFSLIDCGFEGEHFEPASNERSFGESIFYDLGYRGWLTIRPTFWTKQNRGLFEEIESELFDRFSHRFGFKQLVKARYDYFQYQYRKFSALFRKKKPKRVYLVCSYGKEGMIEAAHHAGAKVIELQHGTMGNYHMGYSFPDGETIAYFPDKLVLFGHYWKDTTAFPSHLKSVEIAGFPDMIRKLRAYRDVERDEKRIVFISQWTIGKQLSEKAVETARANPQYSVVYRLHPAERKTWRNQYVQLHANLHLENLTIDEGDESLHHSMAMSRYGVGVYSTALYEALALGCEVVLFELYGIELMKYLTDHAYAHRLLFSQILRPEELPALQGVDRDYFFGDVNDDSEKTAE